MVVGSGRGKYVVTIVLYINYIFIYIYTICMFRISQRTAILIVVGSFLYKCKCLFSRTAALCYDFASFFSFLSFLLLLLPLLHLSSRRLNVWSRVHESLMNVTNFALFFALLCFTVDSCGSS